MGTGSGYEERLFSLTTVEEPNATGSGKGFIGILGVSQDFSLREGVEFPELVYFFTWRGSRKCSQILANPRVALCRDRVQIEGIAEILGGLFDPVNVPIRRLFDERFPETVERWRDRPGMVLARITPKSVVLAGEPGDQPHLQFIDLENGTAYAEPWANR